MRILALEFSSSRRSVAVLSEKAAEAFGTPALPGKDRELKAFALIDEALGKSGLARNEIDCIAVGAGPGSYTGIRAAIAIAQGWNVAGTIKLVSISSVESMAQQAAVDHAIGTFSIAVDAQRGEYYVADYANTNDAPQLTKPLRLISEAELQSMIANGMRVYGPDLTVHGVRELFPSAMAVARLALRANEFLRPDEMEPIYLRETAFVKAPPAAPLPSA